MPLVISYQVPADRIFAGISKSYPLSLHNVQNRLSLFTAARLVFRLHRYDHVTDALAINSALAASAGTDEFRAVNFQK